MPPSREPLLMPFDVCLLGRLVADPDRPFDDYVDMVDVGIDVVARRFRTKVAIPINGTIYRPRSDLNPLSPTTEGTTVTSTGATMYSLPWGWSTLYRDCIVEAFQTAALQLGESYYVVTAMRTIDGYSIIPDTAAGSALDTQQTEFDRSRILPSPPTEAASSAQVVPGKIVIAIIVQGVVLGDRNGCVTLTLEDTNLETCFLDWRRGPSEPSTIGADVVTRRRRYICEITPRSKSSDWIPHVIRLMRPVVIERMYLPIRRTTGILRHAAVRARLVPKNPRKHTAAGQESAGANLAFSVNGRRKTTAHIWLASSLILPLRSPVVHTELLCHRFLLKPLLLNCL